METKPSFWKELRRDWLVHIAAALLFGCLLLNIYHNRPKASLPSAPPKAAVHIEVPPGQERILRGLLRTPEGRDQIARALLEAANPKTQPAK